MYVGNFVLKSCYLSAKFPDYHYVNTPLQYTPIFRTVSFNFDNTKSYLNPYICGDTIIPGGSLLERPFNRTPEG